MTKENDLDIIQKKYNECVKVYEAEIKDFLAKESEILTDCRKDPNTAACKLFDLSNSELDVCSKYLIINGISVSVLGIKNEAALGEARKTVLKSIIYIENIVTGKVNVPFSDY